MLENSPTRTRTLNLAVNSRLDFGVWRLIRDLWGKITLYQQGCDSDDHRCVAGGGEGRFVYGRLSPFEKSRAAKRPQRIKPSFPPPKCSGSPVQAHDAGGPPLGPEVNYDIRAWLEK